MTTLASFLLQIEIALCFPVPSPRSAGQRRAPATGRENQCVGSRTARRAQANLSSILPCFGSSTVVPKCTVCAVSGYLSPALKIVEFWTLH